MIKSIQYATALGCLAVFFFGTALSAHAQMVTNLNSGPLFNEQNMAPGETYHATIEVENTYSESREVYIVGHNAIDPHGLAEEMRIVIAEGNTEHYNASFSDFLSEKDGDISLGNILGGGETEYELGISFLESGLKQNSTLTFDICVGFAGGAIECSGSSNENDEEDGQTQTTSGGGGSSGGSFVTLTQEFSIFNENATAVSSTSAIVTWETNLPGSSEVVYGSVSNGPYAFNAPAGTPYGYQEGTAEDPSLVTNHNVVLTGLTPGVTYAYRVVSRDEEGNLNASSEFTVAIPTEGEVLGAATTYPQLNVGQNGYRGVVAGASVQNDTEALDVTPDGDERPIDSGNTKSESENQAAAVALGSEGLFDFLGSSGCIFSFLLVLLGIFLVWKGIDAFYGWKHTLAPAVRTTRMLWFFAVGTALAFSYALITESCVLVPFAALFIGAAGTLLWRLWNTAHSR